MSDTALDLEAAATAFPLRRATHPGPPSLEERIDDAIRMSDGSMPIAVRVPDEAERARAEAHLAGRRRGKLVSIEIGPMAVDCDG